MHSRLTATFAFSAAAAVISLAGCSGSSTPAGSQLPSSLQSIAHAARPPLGSRAAVRGLILDPNTHPTARFPQAVNPLTGSEYVLYCGFTESACYVINSSGSLVTTLTTGLDNPQGVAVGALTSNWYIASTDNFTIPEYSVTASGSPSLITTYNSTKDQYPVWPAVFEKGKKKITSTLAISNIFNTSDKDPTVTTIDEKTGKTKTLTDFFATEGIAVAFDSSGNCYWSYNPGTIVEYKKCKGDFTKVVTGIKFAGGLAFDSGDNLWYADQEKGVYKCTGTSNCTLQYSGFGDTFSIAFDSTFSNLYVSDAADEVIDICPLSGSTCSTFYTTPYGDQPYGVALIPPLKP
jgi:hypothetical protein